MLQMGHCHVGADGKIDWVTYLNTDGVGTPRIGTDVAKNVVWRWDGEAFGETAPTQAVPSGAYPVIVNLRNPGQYADQETGLFYNMARYYNPQAGRYISSDPTGLGGGLNTYAYADSSPLGVSDELGLSGNCGSAHGFCNQSSTPDAYSLNVDLYVASFSLTITNYGDIFVSGGFNRSYPNPASVGVSLTAMGLTGVGQASQDEINNFLNGATDSATYFDVVGGGVVYSPGTGQSAVVEGIGVGKGFSGTYGKQVGSLNSCGP